MRSRYSAFALGEVEYLRRTLHSLHPDHARAAEELEVELRASCARFKYPGVEVLDHRPVGPEGDAQVLFLARVFERGRERSFVECSRFRQEGGGWRYLGGRLRPLAELGEGAGRLTLDTFP